MMPATASGPSADPRADGSAAAELLPLSIGDVFDEAFDLYKRNFALFAGIVAAVAVPTQILFYLANSALGIDDLARRFTDGGDTTDPTAMLSAMLGLMVVGFLEGAAYSVVHVIQSGALTIAISERYLGRSVSLRAAYGRALRRLTPLLFTWVLVAFLLMAVCFVVFMVVSVVASVLIAASSLAGGLGEVFAVILGISILVLGSLAAAAALVVFGLFVTQIVTLEGVAFGRAIDRNRQLVRKRVVRISFGLILLGLILGALWAAVYWSANVAMEGLVFSVFAPSAELREMADAVLPSMLWLVIEPFWLVVVTLMYYDQRVRREGFDLTVLDRQVQAVGVRAPRR